MDSEQLFDEWALRAKTTTVPWSVTEELTTRCNERCVHCYIADHNRPELSTAEHVAQLRDLKDAGTFHLTLTGGEVLLRNDFLEIVTEARRLRFSVTIFTNATLMTSDIAAYLAKIGVHEVGVSVYSMVPQVHDTITTIKGSWKRTMRGIDHLRSCGMTVSIKCPVTKLNFDGYGDVISFGRSIGATVQMSPTITVMDDGCDNPTSLRISKDELDVIVADPMVLERSEMPTYYKDVCQTVPCAAVFSGGALDSLGNVYPCNQYLLPIGNIRESPFSVIWKESPVIQRLRELRVSDLDECSTCNLYSYCTRCPGSAHLEDGDQRGCSQVARELAESRKRCGIYPAASSIFSLDLKGGGERI